MVLTQKYRRSACARNLGGVVLAALLCWSVGADKARAETQLVIDPTEVPEPAKPPAPAAKKPSSGAAQARMRQRAEIEQSKRAKADARALAAENEAAKQRALEQERMAAAAARALAAKDAAAKAASRRAAAQAEKGRIAAAQAATARLIREQRATSEAAAKEAEARELAARQAAAKDAARMEAAAREATAKDAAAREVAAREAAARLAAMDAATRVIRVSRPTPRFGTVLRDCANCPELVWLPQGEFMMGESTGAGSPRHGVRIDYMLAVGRFEVTFAEWDACVAAQGCRYRPDDSGWGRGWQPVINVSWMDARQYVAWLSRRTGKSYRLLSEAEWEYAARAGSQVRYWWGNNPGHNDANCHDCGSSWDGRRPAPVGRFGANPFGLHDMHGNVAEWVEDCHHDGYRDAPNDGAAWTRDCSAVADARVLRGGAWDGPAETTRAAARSAASTNYYDNRIGFRVARTE